MWVLVGWPEAAVEATARVGTSGRGAAVTVEAVAGFPTSRAGHATLRVAVAGRLYNRAALAATMTALEPARSLDDAGVVLRLWEERGVAALAALRGAFAVSVWDGRLERLVVARDQLGLVPLYMIGERDRLAVSVSLPALLALPGVSTTWDAVALDALLTIGTIPAPLSPYLGVRQLGPGESVVWEDGRLRVQRWWQLGVPDRAGTRGDGVGAVRERLAEAVRLRAGGVRTRVCLSGGLGAVSLLLLAAAERRAPPSAVTFAQVRDGDLEVRQAARVAASAGVPHAVIDRAPDWLAVPQALVDVHGVPVPGFAVAYLSLATDKGWRLLTGHGAEAVLGGSVAHRHWLALARLRALPGPVRDLVRLGAHLARRPGVDVLKSDRPLAALACVQQAVRRLEPAEREELYTPDMLRALDGRSGDDLLGALAADAVAAGADHPLDVIHYVVLQLELPQLSALHLEAAHRGAELRLPFLDHRLAQVALGVAPETRGSAFGRLALLRRGLAVELPRSLARQPPRKLAPAPGAWTGTSLRDALETYLAPQALAATGVLRVDTVQRLVAEHRGGVADHAERLWALIVVSCWLRRAGRASASPAMTGA